MIRGSLGALGLVLLAGGVLGAEALHAAKRTYLLGESAPPIDGTFIARVPVTHTTLRLMMIGDSTAAGVGASVTTGTVGGHLATLLSESGISTHLASVAVSGSRARDLGPQVSRALLAKPNLAVILIGANDATHLSSLGGLRTDIGEAVDRLRAAGIEVVVGTCPDLDAAFAFMQPLRSIAGWQGRRVARTERALLRGRGVFAVDIAHATGPTIKSDPARYLSVDRLHPNDEGYGLFAAALLGPVRQLALELMPEPVS